MLFSCVPGTRTRSAGSRSSGVYSASVLIRSYVYMILGVHLELARAYGLAMQEMRAIFFLHCRSIVLDAEDAVSVYC